VPFSCPYSPERVEGVFSEVRAEGVLGSSLSGAEVPCYPVHESRSHGAGAKDAPSSNGAHTSAGIAGGMSLGGVCLWRRRQAALGGVRLPLPGHVRRRRVPARALLRGGRRLGGPGATAEAVLGDPTRVPGGDHFVAISFNNPPPRVSDPTNPDEIVPAPKDWVSWYQEHPRLETSEPQPTSVGGVQGRLFDTAVSDLPEGYYSQDCLGTGVPLWPLLRGHQWCAELEGFVRTIVLDGVEGETVIIDVWSDTGVSEKVLSEAKEVLDTVEWQDA